MAVVVSLLLGLMMADASVHLDRSMKKALEKSDATAANLARRDLPHYFFTWKSFACTR